MIPLPSQVDDLATLSQALDAADHETRLAWLGTLNKKEMKKLYGQATGTTLNAAFFHADTDAVVIHHGKNSLPAFTRFQKRMIRVGDRTQGYNDQTMAWLTGPGHFLVRPSQDVEGEFWLDYTWEPDTAPEVFPAVKSNMSGTSRLVYGGMIDVMRRVSANVTIGAAVKKDKLTGDYFTLCRE